MSVTTANILNRDGWIGPLAGWELARLARRGQVMRARMIVLACVFAAAIAMPILWFSGTDPIELFFGPQQIVSIKEEATFASHFSLALLEAVLLVVAILAPAYGANAVAEEKERRTLSLLYASMLSNREIVLGKAIGRFGVLMAAAAAAAPAMVLTTMYGGVSLGFLIASAAIIFSTGALGVAIGIESACCTSGSRPALIRAYGLSSLLIFGLFGPFFFATPFAVMYRTQLTQMDIAMLVEGQLFLACILIGRAIWRVRRDRSATIATMAQSARFDDLTFGVPVPVAANVNYRRRALKQQTKTRHNAISPRKRPWMDEDDPVLWKERYIHGATSNAAMIGIGRIALVVAGLLCFMFVFVGAAEILHQANWKLPATLEARESLARGASFALGLFAVPAALRLGPAVSRERQRGTLDALLTLPIERSTLLWAKTRASIESTWAWLTLAIPAACWAFSSAGDWLIGLFAALAVAGSAFFVVGFGAVLSVNCSSEIRAFRFLLPAVALVIALPIATFHCVDWHRTGDMSIALAVAAGLLFFFGAKAWKYATRNFWAAI